MQSLIVKLANLGWRLDHNPCSVISLQPAISNLYSPCKNSMMASRPRSLILQQRRIKLWMPVAPCGKLWMKSKISASLAFNRQMVSNPRCFNELKKFVFIWSTELLVVTQLELDSGLVTVVSELQIMPVDETGWSLFELTSRVDFSLKVELVMDWFDAEDVEEEVHVEPADAELQDRIARQWITGRTSRQNSGWYRTSLHFWQTWAKIARSFWLGNNRKKSNRNLLSCHNSSQEMNLWKFKRKI